MFPVISLLRRSASAYVYVTSRHLQKLDGKYWLRLQKAASSVNLPEGTWNPATDLAPMYMLSAKGASSADAAIALTKKENEVYEKIRAHDLIYTLVMGPEDEGGIEGEVERRARYALVRGVFRASAPSLERAIPKKSKGFRFGGIPASRDPRRR